MTENEFIRGLTCELVPATEDGTPEDKGGIPIKGFIGLFFRPLDVSDMETVSAYAKKNGKEQSWKMVLARSVRTKDGKRVMSDEAADKLTEDGTLANPVMEALTVIRRISGQIKDDDEKKTTSTESRTKNSSGDSPKPSRKPSGS